MKMNWWLVFGIMLSTSLLAQQVTNAPPAAPLAAPAPAAVATNPPAATVPAQKPATKSAPKKKTKPVVKKKDAAAELKTVPLVPGPAVVEANHVNVRGQPKLSGEVIARLEKGQAVTVLEEITRNNSGPDEPSAWAKILLPTNAHVWVSSAFVDGANKTVKPKKLNLRSGPGENYSIIGQLQRGEAIKEIGTKADWIEIEPPTNTYAFVAAQYLKQETPAATVAAAAPAAPATPATPTPATPTPATPTPATPAPATPAPTTTPAEPAPTPATVAEAPAIAAAPSQAPAIPATAQPAAAAPPIETAPATNIVAETPSSEPASEPAVEEPPPKRIVDREGIVRGTVSIQAPSHFGLYSPDNGQLIDYLWTKSIGLDLRRYKGLRIVVTGEESLEERWGNTPVINIQKIQVVAD